MLRCRPALLLAWNLALLSSTGCWKAPRSAIGGWEAAASSGASGAVKDIPLPPDAQTQAKKTLIMGQTGSWTGRLVFSTKLRPGEAFTFYQELMEPHGWHLLSATRAKTSLLTCLRGERIASIQIEAGFLRGSTILVIVSPYHGQALKAPGAGVR